MNRKVQKICLIAMVAAIFVVYLTAAAFACPCIEVTKNCNDAIGPGSPITFSGTVHNCGGYELTNVTIVDDQGTPGDTSDDVVVLGPITLTNNGGTTDYANFSGSYIPTTSPSTDTVTATGYALETAYTATASATCSQTGGKCWLTAGGVKFSSITGMMMAEYKQNGPLDSVGGNVYPGCNAESGDGGNWNHIAHKENLHFQGTDIQIVRCGNVDGIPAGSESPVTPFNFIEFKGTGTLKGISGNKANYGTVCFFARAEDRNEPGNEKALLPDGGALIDRYYLRVFDCSTQNVLLLVDMDNNPATIDPITITGGNFQIHISSCSN